MLAIWDVNKTTEMRPEENLRNQCRMIEDEYITWSRYQSLVCGIQWPSIGELGRYTVEGTIVTFVKHRRYVDVLDAAGTRAGRVPVHAGMACDLYELAGTIYDRATVAHDTNVPLTSGLDFGRVTVRSESEIKTRGKQNVQICKLRANQRPRVLV